MKEYKEFIHDEFERIKSKISHDGSVSYLYGEKIDINDIEQLVVAAYYVAQQEEMNKQAKTNDVWASLMGLR